MIELIHKIRDYFEYRKMRRICSQLELSERGKCVIQYLENIVSGKDVYIEAYEEILTPLIEDGMSRVEAAEFQLSMFNALKELGVNFND